MNVNLTPELEALVRKKVESGLYNNRSEVVREALRLLVERDHAEADHTDYLRRRLAEGIAQAERGELIDGPEAVRQVREERRRARSARLRREDSDTD